MTKTLALSRRQFLAAPTAVAALSGIEILPQTSEAAVTPNVSRFITESGDSFGFVIPAEEVRGFSLSEILALPQPSYPYRGEPTISSVNCLWVCAQREDCPNAGYFDMLENPQATEEDIAEAASLADDEACPGQGHSREWLERCDACPSNQDPSRYLEEGEGIPHLQITFFEED